MTVLKYCQNQAAKSILKAKTKMTNVIGNFCTKYGNKNRTAKKH